MALYKRYCIIFKQISNNLKKKCLTTQYKRRRGRRVVGRGGWGGGGGNGCRGNSIGTRARSHTFRINLIYIKDFLSPAIKLLIKHSVHQNKQQNRKKKKYTNSN